MERATGFEPVTTSLEGWDSTAELRPPESATPAAKGVTQLPRTRDSQLTSLPSQTPAHDTTFEGKTLLIPVRAESLTPPRPLVRRPA